MLFSMQVKINLSAAPQATAEDQPIFIKKSGIAEKFDFGLHTNNI